MVSMRAPSKPISAMTSMAASRMSFRLRFWIRVVGARSWPVCIRLARVKVRTLLLAPTVWLHALWLAWASQDITSVDFLQQFGGEKIQI